MNNALYLFLILLLGLGLCSFLGGDCGREGLEEMTNTGVTQNTGVTTTSYDNYNHFSTNGGGVYYGPNGGVAKIIMNPDGTHSLQVTLADNSSPVIFSAQPQAQASTQNQTFYGPNGNTASIVNTQQGLVIEVKTSNGTMTFSSTMPAPSSNMSSTQYYGSTGSPIQSGSYSLSPFSAGAVTGPAGNTAYYAQGSAGNSVSSPYSSSLATGIPKSQIPAGEEDLYILKSQVVPPVCPACPVSSACPREKPCTACPPCARCPEPSMTCKAVPNYSAMGNSNDGNMNMSYPMGSSINDQYIPVPVLNDFSTFGA